MDVSIIIPTHNEGQNVTSTIESIVKNTQGNYEIIVVEDGSTVIDFSYTKYPNVRTYVINRVGSAKARNFGASRAEGKFLVFLDAHMALEPLWLDSLIETYENTCAGIVAPAIYDSNNRDSIGYGFSIKSWALEVDWLRKLRNHPYEIPMAGAACMLMKNETFRRVGGFDYGIRQWGSEDVELSIRAWTFGLPIYVNPNVEVGHIFRSEFPYEISAKNVNYNILRTANVHFNKQRFSNVKNHINDRTSFIKAAFLSIMRKKEICKKRLRDDDWYFEKFRIKID